MVKLARSNSWERLRCTCQERLARRFWARRSGATVLEMALVAPVVFMLLFGMLDLGIAVYAYNTMAEAVRAGTRYAVVHGSKATQPVGPAANDATVQSTVRSHAPGLGSSELTVTSTWPDGNNAPGSRITVAATYTYRPAVSAFIGLKPLTLSSTSTMIITH